MWHWRGCGEPVDRTVEVLAASLGTMAMRFESRALLMSRSLSELLEVRLHIVHLVVLASMVLEVSGLARACGAVLACSSLRPLLLPSGECRRMEQK